MPTDDAARAAERWILNGPDEERAPMVAELAEIIREECPTAALREENEAVRIQLVSFKAELRRSDEENTRLREALGKYGFHANDCNLSSLHATPRLCTCGYLPALAAKENGD